MSRHVTCPVSCLGRDWCIETGAKGTLLSHLTCFFLNMLSSLSLQGPHSCPYPGLEASAPACSPPFILSQVSIPVALSESPSFPPHNRVAHSPHFSIASSPLLPPKERGLALLTAIWTVPGWCLPYDGSRWMHWRNQALAHLFSKGPDREYFRLCGPYGICGNYSTLLFKAECGQ